MILNGLEPGDIPPNSTLSTRARALAALPASGARAARDAFIKTQLGVACLPNILQPSSTWQRPWLPPLGVGATHLEVHPPPRGASGVSFCVSSSLLRPRPQRRVQRGRSCWRMAGDMGRQCPGARGQEQGQRALLIKCQGCEGRLRQHLPQCRLRSLHMFAP